MNDKSIIDLFKILYPEQYESTYVFTYPTFNNELKKLLERSGYLNEFKSKYLKGLRFLENLKKKCILNASLFEELLDSDGIYSMRIKGEKNIRILFGFEEVEGKDIVILYNSFQEKRTKDYSENIKLAQSRRYELFGIQ